ncbi:Alkaline phosphatase synthesis sensor protein PhoR [bioreactor metagenome]|uniref:histidine kinase n=1 Tax=bioreactor metagenome TaxID=1076179 RepID=A0A645BJA0_9ZZZZ
MSRTVTGCTLPFESVAFERNVTLETNISEGIKVYGNAEQLGQVVSILIDNAIEHTDTGGTTKLELKQKNGAAVMRVSNSGKEIPAEHREKIFERFYRLDEARSGDSNHYGLGLSITKAIITEHKGKISVDCAGGLTTFTVSFTAASQ